jgi:hypothetical protein
MKLASQTATLTMMIALTADQSGEKPLVGER